MEALKNLTPGEKDTLFEAPVLVAILIAGADNDYNKAELQRAIELTHDRRITARRDLLEFYELVGEGIEDKLKVKMHKLPSEAAKRNPVIIEELAKLNDILPKLNSEFANDYYWSLRSMADKIAQASGGLLGYMSVGYEESKLVGLEMINEPG